MTLRVALITLLLFPACTARPLVSMKRDNDAREHREDRITIDSDKIERYSTEHFIVFIGTVIARQHNSVLYADRMVVYLNENGSRILKTVATGSVSMITSDCQTGMADRAEYDDVEERLVLAGNARVWQDDNVTSGERIVIYMSQGRSFVLGGRREQPGRTPKPPALRCTSSGHVK